MLIFLLLIFSEKEEMSMTKCRQRAPITHTLSDGTQVAIYSHNCVIRVDFMRDGVRRHQVVSLTTSQYETLAYVNIGVINAIKKTTEFRYHLGGLTYIAVESYKNVWSVSIRQYYLDDEGTEKPGRWGVQIPFTAWVSFTRKLLHKIGEL